jgi:hypothetical protein
MPEEMEKARKMVCERGKEGGREEEEEGSRIA